MLIYCDANIVQYCAPWEAKQPPDPKLEIEIEALNEIIELAAYAEVQDMDHRWDVAAPEHLLNELERGRLTKGQLRTYRALREAWRDVGIEKYGSPDADVVSRAQRRLAGLGLRHPPDVLHLAEAVAMRATWFLTCDKEILKKTRGKAKEPGVIEGVTVGCPSELRARMTFDAVFGLRVERGDTDEAPHIAASPGADVSLFDSESVP